MTITNFTFNCLQVTTGLLLAGLVLRNPVVSALGFQTAIFTAGAAAAVDKRETSEAKLLGRGKELEEALEFAEEKSEFWRRKFNESEAFHQSLNQEETQ